MYSSFYRRLATCQDVVLSQISISIHLNVNICVYVYICIYIYMYIQGRSGQHLAPKNSERRGNNLKTVKDFYLTARARIRS